MQRYLWILALLAISIYSSQGAMPLPSQSAVYKNDVLAKVGDEEIRLSQFQARLAAYPKEYASILNNRENKVRVLNQMIDEEVLLVEADKKGYEKTPEFKEQLDAQRKRLLVAILLRDNVENKIRMTDKQVLDYYNKNAARFSSTEQRRVSHILIKTEAAAKKALADLKRGAKFADVARKSSIDPSAANGGDLGYITKGDFVPAFENAALALTKKNNLSPVVKTTFGYHIIQLVDIRTRPKIAFASVKEEIRKGLLVEAQRKVMANYLDSVKKTIKITRDVSLIK